MVRAIDIKDDVMVESEVLRDCMATLKVKSQSWKLVVQCPLYCLCPEQMPHLFKECISSLVWMWPHWVRRSITFCWSDGVVGPQRDRNVCALLYIFPGTEACCVCPWPVVDLHCSWVTLETCTHGGPIQMIEFLCGRTFSHLHHTVM